MLDSILYLWDIFKIHIQERRKRVVFGILYVLVLSLGHPYTLPLTIPVTMYLLFELLRVSWEWLFGPLTISSEIEEKSDYLPGSPAQKTGKIRRAKQRHKRLKRK